jgi:SAM-dependent methyltransferase
VLHISSRTTSAPTWPRSSDRADGPQLIFGDAKNRELVAGFYGELPFKKLYFEQMADFLSRLSDKLNMTSQSPNTLKILEMGAGTGGTTKVIVPLLAKLGVPVEYTFTDLSPSLVTQANRRFKQYLFMKFAVHGVEKPPAEAELVIASNAVHATHSLHGLGREQGMQSSPVRMAFESKLTLRHIIRRKDKPIKVKPGVAQQVVKNKAKVIIAERCPRVVNRVRAPRLQDSRRQCLEGADALLYICT